MPEVNSTIESAFCLLNILNSAASFKVEQVALLMKSMIHIEFSSYISMKSISTSQNYMLEPSYYNSRAMLLYMTQFFG